jgi:hypothetical protein
MTETANQEGWIEHVGNDCPVPFGTIVDVKHRDGIESHDQQAWGENNLNGHESEADSRSYASVAFWQQKGMRADIVAYRVVQEAQS